MTQHVGLSDEGLRVLRWLVLKGNLLPVELMQMLLVFLVASLAIAEILACIAVEPVLSAIDRLLTAVAREP